MASFDETLASAKEQYALHLAEWQAGLTPEQLALMACSSATPYLGRHRISIEWQPGSVVYRSIHPYVGIKPLQRKQV